MEPHEVIDMADNSVTSLGAGAGGESGPANTVPGDILLATQMPAALQAQAPVDPGILLRCLELEWQDHFQTRQQTWRTLEIVVSLVVAMIGLDWQLKDPRATLLAAILVINAGIMGAMITRRHRNVEIAKFRSIIDIERRLGLQAAGLFVTVKEPAAIEFLDVIKPLKQSTPLFIMRMHFALMSFGVVYFAFRLITPIQ